MTNNKNKSPGAKEWTFARIFNKFGTLFILILMFVASALMSPSFLSKANLLNILTQVSVTGVIACGITMVIICGLMDLSPGSVLAFAGVVCTGVLANTGSLLLGILAGLAVGLLCGLVTGVTVVHFNLPPFIVTLAMMNVARGAALVYTGGRQIINLGDTFCFIGQGYLGIIPMPVVIMFVCVLITGFVLNKTRYGRYLYAIGGNGEAALASGINVRLIKIIVYAVNGFAAGLAGIVLMSRVNVGLATLGEGYEFDAIIATVVGGTSLSGGRGNILGTLLGALIIGILNNMLNLMGVSPYNKQIVTGVVIVLAVILDVKTKAIRAKG